MARHVLRSSASEGCSCGWCEVSHLKGQQLVNRLQELGSKSQKFSSPSPPTLLLLLPPKPLGVTRTVEQRRFVKTARLLWVGALSCVHQGAVTGEPCSKKMTVTIGPEKKTMKQLSIEAFMKLNT